MAEELGPTGRMVDRFLARLRELDLAQWGDVVRSWRDTLRRTEVWAEAEDTVGDAIARSGRHDAQWTLQEQLFELFRASPWYTVRTANAAPGTEAAAQYLASTAAFALLVADAIGSEPMRTLYAPFAGVIPLAELLLPRNGGWGTGGSKGRLPAA